MEWLGIEIHPDTPLEGVPIERMFRPEHTRGMMQNLRAHGAQAEHVCAFARRSERHAAIVVAHVGRRARSRAGGCAGGRRK